MVPAETACDCNPLEPRQRPEKSDRAIATLISCAAGAVHSPFGASDSMTSTDRIESAPPGTGARIRCSRFNLVSEMSVNSFDEFDFALDVSFCMSRKLSPLSPEGSLSEGLARHRQLCTFHHGRGNHE